MRLYSYRLRLLGAWQTVLTDRNDCYFQFNENGQLLGCECPNATDLGASAVAIFRFVDGALIIEESMNEDAAFVDAGILCSHGENVVPYAVFKEVGSEGRPPRMALRPVEEVLFGQDVWLNFVNG